MNLAAHLQNLQERHQKLEKDIKEAFKAYQPDHLIQALKKQKSELKIEIESLLKQSELDKKAA